MPEQCYRCNHLGQLSEVSKAAEATTGVASRVFLDGAGRLHVHDPNLRTSEFTCSQGHRWLEVCHHRCGAPHCTFGDEDDQIRYTQ